jgi:hypothetical protein
MPVRSAVARVRVGLAGMVSTRSGAVPGDWTFWSAFPLVIRGAPRGNRTPNPLVAHHVFSAAVRWASVLVSGWAARSRSSVTIAGISPDSDVSDDHSGRLITARPSPSTGARRRSWPRTSTARRRQGWSMPRGATRSLAQHPARGLLAGGLERQQRAEMPERGSAIARQVVGLRDQLGASPPRRMRAQSDATRLSLHRRGCSVPAVPTPGTGRPSSR